VQPIRYILPSQQVCSARRKDNWSWDELQIEKLAYRLLSSDRLLTKVVLHLQIQSVNTSLTDLSTKAHKTITGRDLRRGAPEEGLRPGESVMIRKRSGKLFELKRVDPRPKSIVAAVDRIIEEVPIDGKRVKMDAVTFFLENRE
jgi:hypothetical protein